MAEFSTTLQEGLEGEYRVHLAWQYETVEFLGLPHLSDERPLTLQEIYVPLSLTWTAAGDERVYVPDALARHRHLVVLGDPGSGKSTLVKLLAYSFGRIEPTPLARRFGAHLPVPIILRDYRVRRWRSPQDMLQAFIAQLDEKVRGEVTVDWLMAALIQGRGILLLDGLDEVGSQKDRQHLRDKVIRPLLEQMPESMAVLTSRIIGYEEVPFDREFAEVAGMSFPGFGLTRCYVAPFNDDEIDQFISRWYTARERDGKERRRRMESLRKAIRRNDRIQRLAGNPSLLTLMALIHRVTSELPSGRIKLYDKIVEAYLETIQRYRGLDLFEAPLDQMKHWLASVAWAMQQRRTAEAEHELLAPRADVIAWLTEVMEQQRSEAQAEAEAFLDYVVRRSGILIPRGPDQFAFVHLAFQEYFAAWYLRGKLRRFDALIKLCAERVPDAHWHETLVLLFELLGEFPGAGDDLVTGLQKGRRNKKFRQGRALLFAELLQDEQSGLSRDTNRQIAQVALEAACAECNSGIVNRLRQLSDARFEAWIRPWLNERLEAASPDEIGDDFFLVARELERDPARWLDKLGQWVAKRGTLPWHEKQIVDAVITGGDNLEVCAWAAIRLSRTVWLQEDMLFSISLADLRKTELLLNQERSPRHRLLAQLGTAYAVGRLHLLPYLLLVMIEPAIASWAAPLTDVLFRSPVMAMVLELFPVSACNPAKVWAQVRGLIWAGVRNQVNAQTWAWAGVRNQALTLVLARIAIHASADEPSSNGDLASAMARTEWLFGAPDTPSDVLQTHLDYLHKLTHVADEWTRLLALTGVLLLGEGTPDACAERNALLDQGMREPKSFTFPGDVRAAADSSEFYDEFPGLLRHIFLHKPGSPWLQPEWFDPSQPAARFFCASPREFFARAAEILDPNGETELSRWRSKA